MQEPTKAFDEIHEERSQLEIHSGHHSGSWISWLRVQLAGTAGWLYSVSGPSRVSTLDASVLCIVIQMEGFRGEVEQTVFHIPYNIPPPPKAKYLLACHSMVNITMDHSLSLPVDWIQSM